MSCPLCQRRPGWSGYLANTDSGWRAIECRCVTDQQIADLYGHPRNRIAMLRGIAALDARSET